MSKHPECHNCPFNNTGSEECLSCQCAEEYSYQYQKYLIEGMEYPTPDTSGSEKAVSSISEEQEDKFRKFLFELFRLSPGQILTLQGIMCGKSIQEIARDVEEFSRKNLKCSRFKVWQRRKSLLKALGQEFALALTTLGQRKRLKG